MNEKMKRISQPKSLERSEESEKNVGVESPSSIDESDLRDHNDAAKSLPMVLDNRKSMSNFAQRTTDIHTSIKRTKKEGSDYGYDMAGKTYSEVNVRKHESIQHSTTLDDKPSSEPKKLIDPSMDSSASRVQDGWEGKTTEERVALFEDLNQTEKLVVQVTLPSVRSLEIVLSNAKV